MAGLLSAFGRGKQKKDPMRESAALTTVYLLEQNQKFEQFMRQKVDELESRVAAQQARLSTREEAEERELWAAMESFEAPSDPRPAEMTAGDDSLVEPEPVAERELFERGDVGGSEETAEPGSDDESEEMPDYLALMSGAATESNVPAENDLANEPLREADPVEPAVTGADEAGSNDDVLVAGSEDVLGVTNEAQPPLTSEEQDISLVPPPESNELSEAEFESDARPGQPYEMFQVNLPEADEADELWPELEMADEVELLGKQPTTADTDGSGGSASSPKPPTETTEKGTGGATEPDEPPQNPVDGSTRVTTVQETKEGQPGDEADQSWDTSLSQGQKGDWT